MELKRCNSSFGDGGIFRALRILREEWGITMIGPLREACVEKEGHSKENDGWPEEVEKLRKIKAGIFDKGIVAQTKNCDKMTVAVVEISTVFFFIKYG